MTTCMYVIHWLSGLIVVAEAMNKLERTNLRQGGLTVKQWSAMGLKVVAWTILAIGGGGAVITPFLRLEVPTPQDVCVLLGFAILIVRTRVKEG